MYTYDIFLCDSLEKVFPSKRPCPMEAESVTVFGGTEPAVQLVYNRFRNNKMMPAVPLELSVTGAPVEPVFKTVELVPADYPAHEKADPGYLSTEPGLFPDLLLPLEKTGNRFTVKPVAGQYRAVWISFPGIDAAKAGKHTVTVNVKAPAEITFVNGAKRAVPEAAFSKEFHFTLDVRPQTLPEPDLLHTEWFHTDCLSSFYRVDVLGEEHWKIIEAFMEPMARRFGINMVLTPVFTPPLDTEPGGERPTVQLVDIEKNGDSYSFNFDKLVRWCGLCKKHGITHLEIPHFFTQWGAEFTPKIVARDKQDGRQKRIFGWDVKAADPAYGNFLRQMIPRLREVLEENGFDKSHVFFHVSDEPGADHREMYKKAREIIVPLVRGSVIMDALSDIAFYNEGLVEHPVPAINHITPFLEAGVPELWAYYCTGQFYLVPNRFFAMPLARTRAMGILMYHFNIKGFLQWGYNFYYSQNSRKLINPFTEASGVHAWPAGDPFLVYPGEDGTPLSSLRGEAIRESLEDIRVLRLIEQKAGREAALALVAEDFPGPLSFEHYPWEARYYFRLREKAARLLGDTP